MIGKERLRRAYLGKEIDRVPWSPMLYQWFNVNKYNGTLPKELVNCNTTLDVLRKMKADLFAKHEAFIVHADYSSCYFHITYKGNKLKTRAVKTCINDIFGPQGNLNFIGRIERHYVLNTPKGELTAKWIYNEDAGAPFEAKNLWTDFDSEYDRVHALLKDIKFIPDKDKWDNLIKKLGDDGIAHLRIPPTPLKVLHWLAGPERAIYFMADYPDEIADLVQIYEKKRIELIKQVVKWTQALVFTSGDNIDSLMYSPPIFQEFCGHSFRQCADIIHNEGKLLFTHACGQLKQVIKLCQDSGVDGVEGMASPPLGDLEFSEARKILGNNFVLQGGMTEKEEELEGPNKKEVIFDRVKKLFDGLDTKRAFVFGSGCCTGPKASYDNLLALRDACWRYGK